MDTGEGKFEIAKAHTAQELQSMMKAFEEKYPNHGGWFRVGEEVELRGSLFRVKSVKPTEIRLKLLKRKPAREIQP